MNKDYGLLTTIRELPRKPYQPRKILAKCRCGAYVKITPHRLLYTEPACNECSKKYKAGPREDIVDKTFGSWKVISLERRNRNGAWIYKCRCDKCGSISMKTMGELKLSKGQGCKYCITDYHFTFDDGMAKGVLKDGTPFIIDAEDVDIVNQRTWRKDEDGYIVCRYGNHSRFKMQNYIMNLPYDRTIYFDHINRDKTDNRKCNLRYVNSQQNAMNQSRKSNTVSGFKGVTYVKSKDTYRARIWLNEKCVYLGSSHNPVVAAQMYNVAAKLLFREYAGGLNEVPNPSRQLEEDISNKCKNRLFEAFVATQPQGYFLCKKGA